MFKPNTNFNGPVHYKSNVKSRLQNDIGQKSNQGHTTMLHAQNPN